MKLGVRGKLFVVSMALMAFVGLSSGFYLEQALRGWLIDRTQTELLHSAKATRVAYEALEHPGIEKVDALADKLGEATTARITIIDTDGRVLGDSAVPTERVSGLDNHGTRPEVESAKEKDYGVSRRYSNTVNKKMLYVAVPHETAEGTAILRASFPLRQVEESVTRVRLIILIASGLGLIVALFMSGLASHLLSKTLKTLVEHARRIARGQPVDDIPIDEEDALFGGIAGSITRLSRELQDTVDDLVEERNRFEAILETMTEAVVVVDSNDRVSLVNRAALELLEWDDEPVGRPIVELIRVPGFQDMLEQAQDGVEANEEFELPTRPPKQVLAQAARQESIGTVVAMHDVTELRRLETIRRDFVANVSHELRTPVSVIRATAETLEDGAIDQPKHARRFLDALIRNSERLSQLIADLLDISRIEAGEYAIDTEDMTLRKAIDRSLDTVEARADDRDIDIVNQVASDVLVEADPKALDQVLLNLITNAVKYVPDGGTVEVTSERRDGMVRVSVEDDGPGVGAQHRDRLFERFYRIDSGRARNVGGTGLGLSIVKHLVTTMGGQVGYEPNQPKGSVFWFTLPASSKSGARKKSA
jgi:two-component system phosphate regulon sensor histidine kinase PhoR